MDRRSENKISYLILSYILYLILSYLNRMQLIVTYKPDLSRTQECTRDCLNSKVRQSERNIG